MIGCRAALVGAMLALIVLSCAADDPAEVGAVVLERPGEDDIDTGEATPEAADPDTAGHLPVELEAQASAIGVSHYFADDVELGSGQVLRADETSRPLVADVLLTDSMAHCEVHLYAPPDRGLIVHRELEVDLVLEDREGELVRAPLSTLDLDVVLEPGERRSITVDTGRALDTNALRAVWCEARAR